MNFLLSTVPVLATANDIMFIYKACDPLVQALCVLLLLVSLAVWGILFDKICVLMKADENNRRFLRYCSCSDSGPAELKKAAMNSESLAAAVYLAARECLDSVCTKTNGTGCQVRNSVKYKVRAAMSDTIKSQCAALKKRIPFLETAVLGSLLLGITGLFWGFMLAFAQFAEADCSDIRFLAAGIPAALLPLSIALLAAFPAFIGTRAISSRVRMIAVQLELFADGLCTEMQSGPDGMPEGGFLVQSPGEGKAGFVRECVRAVAKNGKTDTNCSGRE